jgi:hypothetical protein
MKPVIIKKRNGETKHLTAGMIQREFDRAIDKLKSKGHDPKIHTVVHGDRVEVNAWPK